MTTWEEIYCKAKAAAQTAGKKTCDMVEITKLKLAAAEAQRELACSFEMLGRLTFCAKNTDTDLTDEIEKRMERIRQQQQELDKLQEMLDSYKKGVRCDKCHTFNSEDSAYCKKCGHAL